MRTSRPLVCSSIDMTLYQKYSDDSNSVDWIQDSILERNRRLRAARQATSTQRGPNGEITFKWITAQVYKAFGAAQTWLVVSLAGMSHNALRCSLQLKTAF